MPWYVKVPIDFSDSRHRDRRLTYKLIGAKIRQKAATHDDETTLKDPSSHIVIMSISAAAPDAVYGTAAFNTMQ